MTGNQIRIIYQTNSKTFGLKSIAPNIIPHLKVAVAVLGTLPGYSDTCSSVCHSTAKLINTGEVTIQFNLEYWRGKNGSLILSLNFFWNCLFAIFNLHHIKRLTVNFVTPNQGLAPLPGCFMGSCQSPLIIFPAVGIVGHDVFLVLLTKGFNSSVNVDHTSWLSHSECTGNIVTSKGQGI